MAGEPDAQGHGYYAHRFLLLPHRVISFTATPFPTSFISLQSSPTIPSQHLPKNASSDFPASSSQTLVRMLRMS